MIYNSYLATSFELKCGEGTDRRPVDQFVLWCTWINYKLRLILLHTSSLSVYREIFAPGFFFCPLFSSLSADEFKTQKNQRSPIFSLLTQLHLGKLKTGQICKCRRVKEIQGYNNPVYSRWTDVPWYRPRAVVRAQLVAELMTLFWSPWSSVVLATLLAFRTSWAVALATALARASNVS